jgi:nicotinate dehydrogenase subunit B
MNRRTFLQSLGGALVVGFSSSTAQPARGAGNRQVDSWLVIGADEKVTVLAGKCDFGQGFRTVQHQLVAEELGVPFASVQSVICETGRTPDQGVSSGSQGHPTQFGPSALRQALATAREALLELASRELSLPVDRLSIEAGVVVPADRSRPGISFGKLIGGKQFRLNINSQAKVKDPKTYRVLGKSIPRLDIPAKVTGEFQYVQDVRVRGMLHGRVLRPPFPGTKLVSVDRDSVKGLPGNVQVVVQGDFIGIVAEREWNAVKAARTLRVTWGDRPPVPSQTELYDWMRKQPSRDVYTVRTPDVDENLAKASKVLKATYLHPYQKHGSMGTSCAVADVKPDSATIWCASQGVYPQRDSVAKVLNLPNTSIRVVYVEGSGCYGLNGADTVAYDAAILSQAVGKPVRVQFSRAVENTGGESFGPAFTMDLRAGLDPKGNIVAWDYEAWTLTMGGRPNAGSPGNIITGALVGFPSPRVSAAKGADPTAFRNNGNSSASYCAGVIQGQPYGTGTVRSERVLTHTIQSPFFTGPLRSPNRLQNTFAHESFIEELAHAVGADPIEYRVRHLRDERLIDVLRAAAKAAQWETRPSPKSGNRKTGIVSGRGASCVLYEGDNGYCALVAEVDVDQATGKIHLKRLVASGDSGPISNPDGFANQLEGGVLHGAGRALFEEITWDDTGVRTVDWRRYRSFQFGDRIPVIETVALHRPDQPHMGAGESTITVSAAAIANAVFDATGVRLRQIPFTPERVLAALKARG